MNLAKKSIAIVGAGKVGSALAKLFADNDYNVRLGVKSDSKPDTALLELVKSTDRLEISHATKAVDDATFCILTVDDDSIRTTCDSLVNNFMPGSVIAHCSGALDSTVLSSARDAGHACCSLHPLNTFPTREAAMKLFSGEEHQTALYCEGDEAALTAYIPMFEKMGFIAQ